MVRHHHATEGYYPNYMWDGNERVRATRERERRDGDLRARPLRRSRALDFIERNRDRPFAPVLTLQLVHWPNLVPTTDPYADMPWTEEMKRYAAHVHAAGHVRRHGRASSWSGSGWPTTRWCSSRATTGTTEERAAVGPATAPATGARRRTARCGRRRCGTPAGACAPSKHSLYEGGIRVPMIAWGPGIVAPTMTAAVAGTPWAS